MRTRVRLHTGARAVVDRVLEERDRVVRRHLRRATASLSPAFSRARAAFSSIGRPDDAWTIRQHARALSHLRELGREVATALSASARVAGEDAATEGVELYERAFVGLAEAATRRRIVAPVVDQAAVLGVALEHVAARVLGVGARAGEEVASVAIAESYRRARAGAPLGVVQAAVSGATSARSHVLYDRIIETETIAGFAAGSDAIGDVYSSIFGKMRRVWDSTLDMRVCRTCAELHHVVVDEGEPWPGGITDEPAHPRCRCATLPWLDDWSDALRANGPPGARTGVQASSEFRLDGWGDRSVGAETPEDLVRFIEGRWGSPAVPPAPPPGIQAGVHAASIEVPHAVSAESACEILQAVAEQPHLISWLEREKLGTLRFVVDASAIDNANGDYNFLTRELRVVAARTSETFGGELRLGLGHPWPGRSWSSSVAAVTAIEAARRTLLHELGHHVHLSHPGARNRRLNNGIPIEAADVLVDVAFQSAKNQLTSYAKTNREEFFAEAFALYHIDREALRTASPSALTMVESVMRIRGVDVPP